MPFHSARLLILLTLTCAAQRVAAADSADLVEVQSINPRIRVELPYATSNNFVHRVMYSTGKCFLRREVAERLSDAQKEFEALGFGLKVWDGYRPLSVQKEFWKLVPDERYVASPVKGSRHNRGAAVDVTLVDREGKELEMPTKFDDFSEAAAADAPCAPRAAENRALLRRVMKAHGFEVLPTEWWHFDAVGWEKYDVLNLSFEEVEARPKPHRPDALEFAQRESLPPIASEILTKSKLDERYEFIARVNPFYVQGDFDADGRLDAAVLVREKATNAEGIAIFLMGPARAIVLGAGQEFGNGGLDFSWMDAWQVVPRMTQAAKRSVAGKGDALRLMKTESASAIVTWDGKGFRWKQEGD